MKTFGYIKSELNGSEYIFENKNCNIPERYTYQTILPKVVNQGNQNICVACSLDCYLNWYRNLINNTPNVDNNFNIKYKQMTQSGIQIKQALSQLLHENKITAYFKVPTVELAKIALITNGPLICGLPVYNSTITKFWNGYNDIEGYHAVTIIGFNKEGLIIRNSWGKSYGINGYAVLPYEDSNKLIELWTMTN